MPNTSEILEFDLPSVEVTGGGFDLPSVEVTGKRGFDLPPVEVTGQPSTDRNGLGSLQEKEYPINPQTMQVLSDKIDEALLNDPEIPNEIIGELSPSNKMEFLQQIIQEASQVPDEEISSMSLEKEQESESIINMLLGKDATEKLNNLGSPEDINFAPTGMNYGGPVQSYNRGGLASMGRMEDTELAHVAPGERIVPADILGDQGNELLDAAFIRAGLDPMEYTAGSGQQSINPMTGMPEYTSFFKRLLRKIKKIAPAIGSVVGFSMGGPMGSAIGKTIGGVIKSGDIDFQDALTDFGTGWALGNFATGMGMQQGSIFGKGTHVIEAKDTLSSIAGEYGVTEQDIINANPNISTGSSITMGVGDAIKIPGKGMWGMSPTPGQQGGVGGFIQNAGARLSGDSNIDLVDEFKNLPMGKKLGVGALGLAALSQTGMFDTPDPKGTPGEITSGIQDIQDYTSRPLTVYNNQPVWGQNAPTINTPSVPINSSPRNKTLMQILEEIGNESIGYQPSPVSFG
jgi:LysM repeat protein